MLCICSKIPADSLIKALTDTFSAAFFQLWWLLCSIGASHPAMNQDFRGNHPLLSQLLLSISPMRPCDSTRRGASDGELLCRLCNYTIEQTDCLGAVGSLVGHCTASHHLQKDIKNTYRKVSFPVQKANSKECESCSALLKEDLLSCWRHAVASRSERSVRWEQIKEINGKGKAAQTNLSLFTESR